MNSLEKGYKQPPTQRKLEQIRCFFSYLEAGANKGEASARAGISSASTILRYVKLSHMGIWPTWIAEKWHQLCGVKCDLCGSHHITPQSLPHRRKERYDGALIILHFCSPGCERAWDEGDQT